MILVLVESVVPNFDWMQMRGWMVYLSNQDPFKEGTLGRIDQMHMF